MRRAGASERVPVDHHRNVPAALQPISRTLGRGMRAAEHSLRSALARVNPSPVFVLGNQKSGTSAIAALLARACGLSCALDMRREVRRPTYPAVVRGEISFARYVRNNRYEFSHELIKEPNLTLLYDGLAQTFPSAKRVFVVRDPRDNLRSLLSTLGIRGDLEALDPGHPALSLPGWSLVLDARPLGIPGDHYVDQLAHRWSHCARVYLEHEDAMALSRYETFEADKLAEIARIAGAIGLPVREDVSAMLERQFQPPGDRSQSWLEFFGAAHLERIEAICSKEMAALGYPPRG